jgi:hypothetical protein
MNAWFNEKGNWCFEFEPSEMEEERFIMLISKGEQYYEEEYKKNPENERDLGAYISAKFFYYILQVVFIGQNYSQSHPTIDKPMHYSAKDALKSAITNFNAEYTEKEVEYIKKHKNLRGIL